MKLPDLQYNYIPAYNYYYKAYLSNENLVDGRLSVESNTLTVGFLHQQEVIFGGQHPRYAHGSLPAQCLTASLVGTGKLLLFTLTIEWHSNYYY